MKIPTTYALSRCKISLSNAFIAIVTPRIKILSLNKVAVVCMTFLLVSCASDQEKEAFNIVGDYFESKVNYSKGFSKEIGKKNVKYLKLNLKGGPYINSEKPKLLAAFAAVLLYLNMGDNTSTDYTDILISLFEDETQLEPNYSKTYPIKTIRNVAEKSKNFDQAAQLLLHGTPSEIFDIIAEDFKNSDEKEPFIATIEKMKRERLGLKGVKLLGVELLINNTTNDRILSFTGHVTWGNGHISGLTVRTFEDSNAKGILTLNIN